jgi:hypothetical protein
MPPTRRYAGTPQRDSQSPGSLSDISVTDRSLPRSLSPSPLQSSSSSAVLLVGTGEAPRYFASTSTPIRQTQIQEVRFYRSTQKQPTTKEDCSH